VLAFVMRGTYLPAFKALRERAAGSRSIDLADLPFIWPADLVQAPDLNYSKAPERRGVSEVRRQAAAKHNAFRRAFSRVLHPFHHDSQAAKAGPDQ